jgi:hypothetical protein
MGLQRFRLGGDRLFEFLPADRDVTKFPDQFPVSGPEHAEEVDELLIDIVIGLNRARLAIVQDRAAPAENLVEVRAWRDRQRPCRWLAPGREYDFRIAVPARSGVVPSRTSRARWRGRRSLRSCTWHICPTRMCHVQAFQ